MSLRVWLPFDRDLNNYGLDGDAVTSTSGSISSATAGKLGNYTKMDASVTLKKNYIGIIGSVCFWVYTTSNDTRVMYFGNDSTSAEAGNRKWSLYAYPSRNDLHSWGCMKDDSTSANGAFTLSNVIPDNTWTHVAWTHDSSNQYIYINGVLKSTVSWNSTGNITFNSSFPIKSTPGRHMNDFRIYDHCLSQREVLELARCPICIYKLNNLGGRKGNPNLLYNTWYMGGMAPSYGATTANTTSIVDNGDGTYTRKIVVTGTPSSWHYTGVSSNMFHPAELKASTSYTFSFYLKTNVTTNFSVQIIKGNATGSLANVIYLNSIGDSQWHRYSGVFTTNSSMSVDGQVIYIYNLEGVGTYEYKWMKLEEGTELTDWCPHTSDSGHYTYSNTVSNSTGLKANELTVVSNPKMTTNSAVYDRSVSFNNSGYLLNSAFNHRSTYFTVAFWYKPLATTTTANRWIFSTHTVWCGNGMAMWSGAAGSSTRNYSFLVKGNNTDYVQLPSVTLNVGTWYHIAITYNGTSEIKMYRDGTLINTTPYTGGAVDNPNLYIGYSKFNLDNNVDTKESGCLNDFRIYNTVLSANDVLELYKVRESINSKSILCREYSDDSSNKVEFKQTGIINSGYLNEHPIFFDYNLYSEPDGSLWLRIFHHNNPSSGVFSSTDPFYTDAFYKDSNKWSNLIFCNYLNYTDGSGSWEFLVKQKLTSSSTEQLLRWTQKYNPRTATYANVAYSNITRNTSSRYTQINWGGIHNNGSQTRISVNNGTSGNWYGAIGSWTQWQGGIPSMIDAAITTGYLDLYIRVDNISLRNNLTIKPSIATNAISANNLIEL